MMIISCPDLQQDTIPHKIVASQDSTHGKPDSARVVIYNQTKDSFRQKTIIVRPVILPDYSDTTSVCFRNSVADITFHDFNNFVFRLEYAKYKQFPFILIERARNQLQEERTWLVKHLKQGNELPANPLHTDWMIIIILVAAYLFSLVKSNSKRMMPYFERVFLFRRKNESISRDVSGIFHWQSTILNLISFLIIGLFGYSVAAFYNAIPNGTRGIVNWLIVLGIISGSVTIRHLVCIITGAASGQQEVFKEYLLGIYHSYRFGALFLFAFIILMTYTQILPVRDFILSGIFIMGIMYLIRVIRLLIIFLNRSVSIFYLILYLCALEILPVLIAVKYFTGLV
jgi:hypothetical protein